MEFLKTDTYKITAGKEKLKSDYKVLIRLYQPIIGAIATNLYLTFDSEITLNNKFNPSINHLLKNMQITIKEFNKAIESLLSVNLLSSIKKSKNLENNYLFKPLPTLSALEFFNNSKLNGMLTQNVSPESYNLLHDSFLSLFIDEDNYEEINMEEEREIDEDTFYIQEFAKYDFLQYVVTEKVKKEISRLKKLFKINYVDIEKYLLQSIEYEKDGNVVNLDKFNNFIENNFSRNENVDPYLKFKQDLATLAPVKFLEGRLKRILTPSETRTLNNLIENNEINFGVMNVILDYSFNRGIFNDGRININYISKLISSVKTFGCDDVDSTMEYFKSISKSKPQIKEEKKVEKTSTKNNNDEDDSELLELLG